MGDQKRCIDVAGTTANIAEFMMILSGAIAIVTLVTFCVMHIHPSFPNWTPHWSRWILLTIGSTHAFHLFGWVFVHWLNNGAY